MWRPKPNTIELWLIIIYCEVSQWRLPEFREAFKESWIWIFTHSVIKTHLGMLANYCAAQYVCCFSKDPVVHYTAWRKVAANPNRPTARCKWTPLSFRSRALRFCSNCSTGAHCWTLWYRHQWKFPCVQMIWTLQTHVVSVSYTHQCWAPAKCN